MASDGVLATIPTGVTPAIQVPDTSNVQVLSGKNSPPGGNAANDPASTTRAAATVSDAKAATATTAATAVKAAAQASNAKTQSKTATATNKADLQALVTQFNRYLNNSGRPNQFRVDPTSQNQTIQEINPASGAVIGQFSVIEFPALARSLGVSGVLVDDHA